MRRANTTISSRLHATHARAHPAAHSHDPPPLRASVSGRPARAASVAMRTEVRLQHLLQTLRRVDVDQERLCAPDRLGVRVDEADGRHRVFSAECEGVLAGDAAARRRSRDACVTRRARRTARTTGPRTTRRGCVPRQARCRSSATRHRSRRLRMRARHRERRRHAGGEARDRVGRSSRCAPSRTTLAVMADARWVLPVPVPPTRTMLRWVARKAPA